MKQPKKVWVQTPCGNFFVTVVRKNLMDIAEARKVKKWDSTFQG